MGRLESKPKLAKEPKLTGDPQLAPIEPHVLYNLNEAARRLGISPRWFKDNLAYVGRIQCYFAGYQCWIMGHSIIEFVEQNMDYHDRKLLKAK